MKPQFYKVVVYHDIDWIENKGPDKYEEPYKEIRIHKKAIFTINGTFVKEIKNVPINQGIYKSKTLSKLNLI